MRKRIPSRWNAPMARASDSVSSTRFLSASCCGVAFKRASRSLTRRCAAWRSSLDMAPNHKMTRVNLDNPARRLSAPTRPCDRVKRMDRPARARIEPPDLSEKGGLKDGVPQRSDERLFMQLLVFGGCHDSD